MDSYFFMGSVLQWIAQGRLFRKIFAAVLQALAVVISILGLVVWMSFWRVAAQAPFVALVGLIIFQLLFVVALYMVAHTLFIRARNIAELPEAEFYVIPIAAIALKLVGEVYASFVAVMSVAGGILIWFMRGYAYSLVMKATPLAPRVGTGEGFIGGLLFMGGGLLAAFVVLVICYFLAEAVVLMADSARNITRTREIAEKYDKNAKKS